MLRGDKEDERAKWSEGERFRGEAENEYRVKVFVDDHKGKERERERESAEENEEKRAKVWERKCDEGLLPRLCSSVLAISVYLNQGRSPI